MHFLVRSMSTTDATLPYRSGGVVVPAQKPVPYHVFLKEAGKRSGAFWSRCGDIARFETEADAAAEVARCGLTGCDIVPADFVARGLPNYWDARK